MQQNTDMPSRLYVSSGTLANIQEHLDHNRFIGAIKSLRSETQCGLKEGKYAIERYQGKREDGPLICPQFDVMTIKVRTPDGVIEVDMEGLQLSGLMSLSSIGLDTCRAVLALHDVISEWKEQHGPDAYWYQNNIDKNKD